MRKFVIALLILGFCSIPVYAEAFTAPPIPESAAVLVPEQPETFSEGLTTVLREAVDYLYPALRTASTSCVGIIGIVLLTPKISPARFWKKNRFF